MVGNIGMFPMYNNYLGYVGLDDMYDMDYLSGGGLGVGAMGMNGSLFPGMGMMPYMGGYNGANYDQYYNQMIEYQNFNNQIQKQSILNQRNLEMEINSPQEGVKKAAAILSEKIQQNEQDQIPGALQNYLEAVSQLYPGQDATAISNRAATLFQQLTGTSLPQALRQYGHSSFNHGFLKAVTFGIFNKKSAEQNISDITGQPVSKKEQAKEIAGLATGGAAVATTGFLLAKNVKLLAKIPKVGWIFAGVAAAGAAIASIFGNRN